jgi:hypothetical protein
VKEKKNVYLLKKKNYIGLRDQFKKPSTKIFHSKTDIIKQFQMSYFTLNKALQENKAVHSYHWKMVN